MQSVWCNAWFLCNMVSALFGFVKRIIFKFRKKQKLDEDLPVTSSVKHSVLPPNDSTTELEWDDWGDGAPTSIRIDSSSNNTNQNDIPPPPPQQQPGQIPLHHVQNVPVHAQGQMSSAIDTGGQEEEEQPEIDFFADMTPKLKKTVLIRKKSDNRNPIDSNSTAGMAMSSRLTMSVDPVAMPSSELAAWEEDNNAWEDEATDLTWEADQVIREKKQLDRERRAMETQRRKMEREAQRASKKDSNKLAVKLK